VIFPPERKRCHCVGTDGASDDVNQISIIDLSNPNNNNLHLMTEIESQSFF
jgi:hypothetical protein